MKPSTNHRLRRRRHRRQAKAEGKHPGAKPKHRSPVGRTGGVRRKMLRCPSKKKFVYRSKWQYVPALRCFVKVQVELTPQRPPEEGK